MSVNLDIPLGSALVFCFQENPKKLLEHFKQKTLQSTAARVFFFGGAGKSHFGFQNTSLKTKI